MEQNGSTADTTSAYKRCTLCGYKWDSIDQFVADGSLRVNGYQAVLGTAAEGVFFLTHECPGCHSTVAVPVLQFADWEVGPRPARLNALQEGCPGHCVDTNNLEPCNADCCMRWVREVLQYLKRHEVPQSAPAESEAASG
jgi:hypothetical protein